MTITWNANNSSSFKQKKPLRNFHFTSLKIGFRFFNRFKFKFQSCLGKYAHQWKEQNIPSINVEQRKQEFESSVSSQTFTEPCVEVTSRERHKSAPYLRLKNSKRTWKCKKTQSQNNKKSIELTRAERGILMHFLTSIVAKHQKLEGWKKFRKKSHNAEKKLKKGPFGIFQHPFCCKTSENWRGSPWWKIDFSKKSLKMPKQSERGLFSLSRYGMLRGKRGKTFLVQFARPNESLWDHQLSRTIEN